MLIAFIKFSKLVKEYDNQFKVDLSSSYKNVKIYRFFFLYMYLIFVCRREEYLYVNYNCIEKVGTLLVNPWRVVSIDKYYIYYIYIYIYILRKYYVDWVHASSMYIYKVVLCEKDKKIQHAKRNYTPPFPLLNIKMLKIWAQQTKNRHLESEIAPTEVS